jgi:hypothetical protein
MIKIIKKDLEKINLEVTAQTNQEAEVVAVVNKKIILPLNLAKIPAVAEVTAKAKKISKKIFIIMNFI